MVKPWLMGIDLGGSGVRCILKNPSSKAQFSASENWHFDTAAGTFGTGFNIDLEEVWSTVGKASRHVLDLAGASQSSISGLAVSAMRFSTVLLDDNGECLFAAPNRDARAAGQCFALADQLGEKILAQTGAWPLPMHSSARLLFLKEQQPELFARIHTVFGIAEWLNQRLCSTRAMDPSQASASGLFSLQEQEWCWPIIDAIGLPRDIFPPIVLAGTALGELSAAAAKHLGLAPDVVVGMAGADTQCSLLGANVVSPGQCAVVVGSTAPVQVLVEQPVHDSSGALMAAHHISEDRWVLESNGGAMGETLNFVSRILFPNAPEPELRLLAEAAQGDPGAAGMLSTLGAELLNMKSPNVPLGHIAMSHMTCIDDPSPRSQFSRSLIEGYCCGLRANILQLQQVLEREARIEMASPLTLCAGLSQSDVFAQLLADITTRDVIVPDTVSTTALGGAICAGVAAKRYTDFATACADLCSIRKTFTPREENVDVNEQLFTNWNHYREAAQATTTPIAADHVLPRLLKEAAAVTLVATEPSPRPQALITAAFDEDSLARMRQDIDVEYASFREVNRLLTGPSLVRALAGKQIFVTEVDILDSQTLEQLSDLRIVAACRGDAVNVDVEACTAFGIPVLYAPARNAIAVADLTIGFMLNLARKLPTASQFLQKADCTAGNVGKMGQAFKQLQGNELWHKTIGLVGLGAVGRAVAQRLAGFDVNILVADPFISPEEAALNGCRLTDLETLLETSDFVSLHAAVTTETRGMIGAAEFARMKPEAFVIDTARAALIDEHALVDALERSKIAGAALDTFAIEPPGFDHPLVRHANVISTPHCAGNTFEVAHHQGDTVSIALLQLLSGQKPQCILNPKTLDKFNLNAPRTQPSEEQLAQLATRKAPSVSDLQRDAKSETAALTSDARLIAAAPEELVAQMRIILQHFCNGMSADNALAIFSQGLDVTLYFTAHDIGLDFYLSLLDGEVASALGAPEKPAQVQLQMRAEILHGMFSGTLDAMEAAMNGEISFTGDAAKAMTLQELNEDMQRIYTIARATVDNLGDLSDIPRTGNAQVTPNSIGPNDPRAELVDIMQELYAAQVITATGGNISVRIPSTDDELWITPSRLFKGDLTPEVMVRINLKGQSLNSGSRSPSSEWCVHARILEKKPEANAVIHAHAPNATILANSGLPFLPISTEAAFFGDIPRIPFLMPGTDELAEAVAAAMRDEWAVLMVNHGVIVGGRSLRRAADMVEIIERSAEIILGCYAVGKEPPVLPPEAVSYFRQVGDIVA